MTKKEIRALISNHKKWLEDTSTGERLNLSDKDLHNIDLSNADLRYAILKDCDLKNANLYKTNLEGADLENSCLQFASMAFVNLSGAILIDTDFESAELRNATIEGASASGADFSRCKMMFASFIDSNLTNASFYNAELDYSTFIRADLTNAEFFNANLSGADLTGSNLECADFNGAILHRTKLDKKEKIRQGIILKEDIEGWKLLDNCLIHLIIPAGSVMFCINQRKCRTNRAIVKEMKFSTEEIYEVGDRDFIYKEGAELESLDFDFRYNIEYSTGITFFRTMEELGSWYEEKEL